MNATQITANLKHWNKSQSVIRKGLMNDYRGIKPVSNQELRTNSEILIAKIDRGLLDIAVYIEFVKLDVE